MKKLFLIVCFVIFFASQAWGATYYIDFDGGDDTAAGTAEGTAWRSIPGSRNTADSGDFHTTWGVTFSSASKVPAGTIFNLKPGTTWSSADANHDATETAGRIIISSTYYATNATAANPIKFVAFQAWAGASGTVTIDGSGMTANDAGHEEANIDIVAIPGIEFDGVIQNGITIKNALQQGMMFSSSGLDIPDEQLDGAALKYIRFLNNGTENTSGESQRAVGAFFYMHKNISIENCEVDGNGLYMCGFIFGGQDRACTGGVTNVMVHDLVSANVQANAAGFLAWNSTLTFTNITVYNVNKGWDIGESSAPLDWPFESIIINSSILNNTIGIGCNNAINRTAKSKLYVINSTIYGNDWDGIRCYFRGPSETYLVHNTFYKNGGNWPSDKSESNVAVYPDGSTITAQIDLYMYNNIFYKQQGDGGNFVMPYFSAVVNENIYSDYNAWIKGTETLFSRIGRQGTVSVEYSYGVNGPGNNTGDWYTEDDGGAGIMHQGCDANSYATDCSDTVARPTCADEPVFISEGFSESSNFRLSTSYPGTDITGQPWFIPAMGTDRDGNARTLWDLGPYESTNTAAPEISNPIPYGTQVCTGPTQSVMLGLSTNETATCIYSPVDANFSNMSNYHSGVTFTNTASTVHSGVTTLASNASYTFYATCIDVSGNSNPAATSWTVTIGECGSPPQGPVTWSVGGGDKSITVGGGSYTLQVQ